jgi:hypothetical protein
MSLIAGAVCSIAVVTGAVFSWVVQPVAKANVNALIMLTEINFLFILLLTLNNGLSN